MKSFSNSGLRELQCESMRNEEFFRRLRDLERDLTKDVAFYSTCVVTLIAAFLWIIITLNFILGG